MRVLLIIAVVAAAQAALPHTAPIHGGAHRSEEIIIDGKTSTIGLTAAKFFSGRITEPFKIVMDAITNVMSPARPEDDIDYFGLIKDDVKAVVGTYINEHNMNQIEAYKDDLAVLLNRYSEAPIEASGYPTKNTMANSLSTVMVANRFLIEAVEWPHSMMLHYADIASMHIMVLKDAAETYSTAGEVPSMWWKDLDGQLEHYITFGSLLQNTVVDWRNDMVTCSFHECIRSVTRQPTKQQQQQPAPRVCYDVWTVDDAVAELRDECRTVNGGHQCDDHCQAYQITMNREVATWVFKYLGKVLVEWRALKLVSEENVAVIEGSRH